MDAGVHAALPAPVVPRGSSFVLARLWHGGVLAKLAISLRRSGLATQTRR